MTPRRRWATGSVPSAPNPARYRSTSSRWRPPMHRSSESVAAIATALAKAQIELQNPEKSAVGSIGHRDKEAVRTFRYAPLSVGLDIVRKTLGGQQIAVMQTTDIDQTGGTVNLTTIFLHTS